MRSGTFHIEGTSPQARFSEHALKLSARPHIGRLRYQLSFAVKNKAVRNSFDGVSLRHFPIQVEQHRITVFCLLDEGPYLSSFSFEIARTTKPWSLNRSYNASRSGISFLHGGHHVAQKLTNTTFPFNSCSVHCFP